MLGDEHRPVEAVAFCSEKAVPMSSSAGNVLSYSLAVYATKGLVSFTPGLLLTLEELAHGFQCGIASAQDDAEIPAFFTSFSFD